jgi:hypothetical protein
MAFWQNEANIFCVINMLQGGFVLQPGSAMASARLLPITP